MDNLPQDEIDPTRPQNINRSAKKHNPRAVSSMTMTRILANPQESTPSAKRTSKFIANSGAPMQKLADLDKKTKFAHMRHESNVFSQTMPASELRSALPKNNRKGGLSSAKNTTGAMSSIMAHDEGPYSKIEWASKKGQVAEKPSQQDTKKIKRQTFIKVMSDKKEPRMTSEQQNLSGIY